MEPKNTQSIICIGNIVDGMKFVGPFDDEEEAIEYAENNTTDNWYVAPVDNPE